MDTPTTTTTEPTRSFAVGSSGETLVVGFVARTKRTLKGAATRTVKITKKVATTALHIAEIPVVALLIVAAAIAGLLLGLAFVTKYTLVSTVSLCRHLNPFRRNKAVAA